MALHQRFIKKRILFLCSQNKLRSPTAEAVFADHQKVEVDSAGLNKDAEVPLSEEQVEWADLILVMEKEHRNRLNRKSGKALGGKRIVVLNIPALGRIANGVRILWYQRGGDFAR